MISVLIDLGKRAVACKYWRWLPGMKTAHNPEYGSVGIPETWVLPVSDGGVIDVGQHYQRRGLFPAALGQCVPGGGLGTRIPDLSDPATLGCLLALVREARNNPAGFVVPERNGNWTYYTQLYNADYWTGGSEAEALVIALENTP